MNDVILSLESVSKSFDMPSGGGKLEILRSIDLTVRRGEGLSIVGKSGSGKSTLLYIAALIEKPSSGRVLYSGLDATDMSDAQLATLRRERMGFVFQNSLLLEDFSALENVAMPLLNKGLRPKEAFARAQELLEAFSLGQRSGHRPFELSGGERQRVAIARALSTGPEIIFADEPTGALDEESQSIVEDMLLEQVRERGVALMLVTHNLAFASRLERSLTLCGKELRS